MLTQEYKTSPEYRCDECTLSKGRPVTFTSKKDLRRHLLHTNIHKAAPAARCSCGVTVTRKDAMRSHRRTCRESTVALDADAGGSGQGSMGMQQT